MKLKHFFPLIFFILIQTAFSETIFNYADLSLYSTIFLPENDSKKQEDESKIQSNAGIKLSFRDVDFRTYFTLPKTYFSEINEELKSDAKDLRYGLGIYLFKKSFPTNIKIGKNTYSKSLSKIKNPSPSSIANPLTKSFAFSSGLGTTLPTLSSSSQPLSSSITFSIPEEKFVFPVTFELFADEEKDSALSISTAHKISRFSSIQTAFTGARFFIENDSSVLKKNNLTFEGDYFLSGLLEIAFKSPILKMNFRTGIQESPFKQNSIWFKIDGRTTFKNILLDFSYFEIPTANSSPKVAPLISANSNIQRTLNQISVNPQIMFSFKDSSSLRFGINFLEAQKITNTKDAEKINVGKCRSAISFESKIFDIRYDFTVANILLSGNPPNKSSTPEKYYANNLSSNVTLKSFYANANFDYKYYPPYNSKYEPKKTFNTSLSIIPGKTKSISIQEKYSITLKGDEKTENKLESSIFYRFKSKKVKANLKCGISIPL